MITNQPLDKKITISIYLEGHHFHSKSIISKKSHLKRMLEDIYEKVKKEI